MSKRRKCSENTAGTTALNASPDLPAAPPEALEHSQRLLARLREVIAASGGWIPFSRYMHAALYEPGLGYYVAGARKFGESGDFVTAPEISPLFARCLAHQAAQVLASGGDVLELGPGTGALAADLFAALEALGAAPERYLLMEVSPDLRERQRERLAQRFPGRLHRFEWLDSLPAHHRGVVIANEVLDTVPCERVGRVDGQLVEMGVVATAAGLAWSPRVLAAGERAERVARLLPAEGNYLTECNPAAEALVGAVTMALDPGVALFIDYGHPRPAYYHPQRDRGTLRCHYRHRHHDDPFHLPGLQDITAHVDFSAVAEAATAAGGQVLGFCTQAQFLLGCGIAQMLSPPQADAVARLREQAALQRLVGPGEMGEVFKVLAIGRGVAGPLAGFRLGRPVPL